MRAARLHSVVSGAEVVAALTKGGFVGVGHRGSHVKLRKDDRVAIVAHAS
jgi:predicted RNA binding protein YcfA (HicA-like mRNA interferase family)